MKIPPRAKKCLDYLNSLEDYLGYYMSGSDIMVKLRTREFRYLREYIEELSQDKKLTEIKLAAKIKKGLEDEKK